MEDSTASTASTPVEAPEGNGGATVATEVTEVGNAVSREQYDALMATFNDYRRAMLATSAKYTDKHGWCREVTNAIREIDPALKPQVFSGTAEVTVRLRVEIAEQSKPVTESGLWASLGNLAYEVSSAQGDATRINKAYGTVEIVSPFTMTTSDNAEIPPYVSPADWAAQQERSQAERDASRQAAGDFGTCAECDENLNSGYDCTNPDCSESVD